MRGHGQADWDRAGTLRVAVTRTVEHDHVHPRPAARSGQGGVGLAGAPHAGLASTPPFTDRPAPRATSSTLSPLLGERSMSSLCWDAKPQLKRPHLLAAFLGLVEITVTGL